MGDMGDISYLDEERFQFTVEFYKLVDKVEELSVREAPVISS